LSAIFGGIGTADAVLVPTIAAKAVAVAAVAKSRILKSAPLSSIRASSEHPMVSRARQIGKGPRDEMSPRMQVDVIAQERYWYPDDGGEVWVAGFQLVDGEGRYLGRDAPELVDAGLRVSRVAGARDHHAEALQSDGAAPARPLTLRRDRENEYDANAIAVETVEGEVLGFVPRELAAEIAPSLDRGEAYSALVLREQRATPRDPRSGLTMLLAPAGELSLRVLPVPRD
jgi:hypothetical protein